MSMQPCPLAQIPEQTMLVARAAFPKPSLAMSVRDQLGEVFTDEPYAAAFGVWALDGLTRLIDAS
jgi:hypothetical protein